MSELGSMTFDFGAAFVGLVEMLGAAAGALIEWEGGEIADARTLRAVFEDEVNRTPELLAEVGKSQGGQHEELHRVEAWMSTLDGDSILAQVARAERPDLIAQARDELEACKSSASGRATAARVATASTLVIHALDEAQQLVVDVQQEALAVALADSLREMGYDLDRADASDRTALWATRDEVTFALTVQGASASVDVHSPDTSACSVDAGELRRRLRHRGLVIREYRPDLHGPDDPNTPALRALRAAARDGCRPVEALLHHPAVPDASAPSAPATDDARPAQERQRPTQHDPARAARVRRAVAATQLRQGGTR